MILGFDSKEISLLNSGGKALNLARLWKAGFNVPEGFILCTSAYQGFIESNNLEPSISRKISGVEPGSGESLETASKAIRSAFSSGTMPAMLKNQILTGYGNLDRGSVAVRSSATTEDLPDLSFAGQQDTYLNVIGDLNLLEAVINCWSSLWTARAMGYRARNAIPQVDASVAVIIQKMVESNVSGVLFTANPINGLRSQTVIDATFGLGEALVSGQVEPDQFIVDQRTQEITSRSIGSKMVSSRSVADGGVEAIENSSSSKPSLRDTQILELTSIGQNIQDLYESPQDIEWAISNSTLYILQSRPITSLFPLPELSFDPLIIWISFGSVQGILGPITPLGQDGIRNVILGAAHLFGQEVDPKEFKVFVASGERIWIRISDFIRNPIGYRLFERLMQFIEPSVVQIMAPLMDEEDIGAGKGRFKFTTLRLVLRFFLPVAFRSIMNAVHPEAARARFDQQVEAFISSVTAPDNPDRYQQLDQSLRLMRTQIQAVFKFVLPNFIPVLAPGMASLVLLNKLAGEYSDLALEILRGLPNNVTTQMDLALWNVAVEIQKDDGHLELFESMDAQSLSQLYQGGGLPTGICNALDHFLARYGMRGVGEIDIGRPRWREDPTPVFQNLLSYLRLPPESAPDAIFKHGQRSAEQAIKKLAQRVSEQRFGWIKAHLVRTASRRMRILIGARESPKFLAIQTMGIIRAALLQAGRLFAQAATIEAPEDVFFLYLHELEDLSQGEERDWKSLIERHRQSFNREKRRTLIPRVLVSDGRAFFEGVGADSDTDRSISGSPVSPGVVEGQVRIVFDPHQAQLEPGDILVCPGTDPAWTPLFLAASGLVTEVGGMMTHGSVVAREYGIPAVVGVHEATSRLENGQRIRLDGSAGTIIILD